MSRRLTILTICGFGVGTSLILRMNIESVLRKHNIEAEVINADVTTGPSIPCDLLFTSKDLYSVIEGQVKAKVIQIENFMDLEEIESKSLDAVQGVL